MFINLTKLGRTQFNTFLDMRRSNNVAIGLSRFTRRGLSPEAVISAIAQMDDEILSVEDLITYQSLLPTADERSLIKKTTLIPPKDPSLPYAPAEAFMIEAVQTKDLSLQVLAFIFKLQLPSESKDIHSKLDDIVCLCRELRSSSHFKKLLKIVLELGNLTNYQYGAGNTSYRPWMGREARAIGFKIDGLARLRDVKSSDGKWSLMTFLVDMIQKNYPEVRLEVL